MLDNENEIIALSISIAKLIANGEFTNPELAVLAAFFSSLASNLSVIIQTRNLTKIENIITPTSNNDNLIEEAD